MTVNGLIARAKIALVAHDAKKRELLTWVKENKEILHFHDLFATGNTGALIAQETGLSVSRYQSGPYGGDQQIGARITEGALDVLVFFWDPLSAAPHDHDVKALMRIAVLYNVPSAYNRATADFIFSASHWYSKSPVLNPSSSIEYKQEKNLPVAYHAN